MEQTQLIELVKTIKPEEKEHLLQFLSLRYFNNGRMRVYIKPLLEICMTHFHQKVGLPLEKAEVYSTVFPGQPIIEGKLEKVMVEAQRVVRSFLLTQYYFRENNEFNQVADFAEIARTRGLESRYYLSLARLKKIQEDSPCRDVPHYFRQLMLEGAIHYVECMNNQSKGDLNISKVLFATEIYYYLRVISVLNRYLLQQRVTRLDAPEFINRLIKEMRLPVEYINESPQLEINFEIFKIIKKSTPEESDLKLLMDLLKKYISQLAQEDIQEFYAYLRNFAVLILDNDGDNDRVRHLLHELYVDSLSRGYLHYEGKIQASRYLAVSNNAITIGRFEWANEFIENFKYNIHGENESQDVYRFNKAHYLFAIGKFDDCLDLIPSTSPFVNYLINGKRLELKALYELKSDLLAYKLDAFRMFLSRTSSKLLSESRRHSHNEFANVLTQIISSIPGDQKRAEKIISRIKHKKQVAESRWLLAKARALK